MHQSTFGTKTEQSCRTRSGTVTAVRQPLHPGLAIAVRKLPLESIADVWRALKPVANELGVRPPSYSATVRLVVAERDRRRRVKDAAEAVWAAFLFGRFPGYDDLVRLERAVEGP